MVLARNIIFLINLKKIINENKTTLLIALAILTSIIIGGGTAVITKIALTQIPSFSFTFLRFVFAAISILPFYLKEKMKIGNDFYKVIILSLFMTANVILFPIGVHLTTATIASVLYVFAPIIVAVLSHFLLKEVFSPRKTTGIIIGFLGALLIILMPKFNNPSPFNGNFTGNIIIFSAVISTALYTVFSKGFQKKYSAIQMTSIFIFISLLILIPLAISDTIIHPNWWKHLSPTILLTTIYTGILGTTIWYFLYQYVIKKASPLVASTVLYLQPASTFIWASFLLGEKLTTGLIIGAVFAFVGVFLTITSKKRIDPV